MEGKGDKDMAKQPDGMFAQVRKQAITEIVNQKGNVTVGELCERFQVSPATIRNDLRELEEAGAIERTHGGAINCQKAVYEPNTYQKEVQHVLEKEAIVKVAAEFIKPGDAIALDTGTTTFQLAKHLVGIERLTVVTNDLQIAAWLERNTDVSILMAGGAVRRHFHCTVGLTAMNTISKLRVDKVFAAANGVSVDYGLSTPSIDMANIKTGLVEAAEEVFLLCDSSKINRNSLVVFAPISQVDVMITDNKADQDFVSAVTEAGVRVICANTENK